MDKTVKAPALWELLTSIYVTKTCDKCYEERTGLTDRIQSNGDFLEFCDPAACGMGTYSLKNRWKAGVRGEDVVAPK